MTDKDPRTADRLKLEALQRDLAHARAELAALTAARDVAIRLAVRGAPLTARPADPGRRVCPHCGEARLVEWDPALRRWGCAVCGKQWP